MHIAEKKPTKHRPLRSEATLTSDGIEYGLTLDVNALCAAEEKAKMTTDQIVAQLDDKFANMVAVRLLLWATLQLKHECTIEEAGAIMAGAGVSSARETVLGLVADAFGLEGN